MAARLATLCLAFCRDQLVPATIGDVLAYFGALYSQRAQCLAVIALRPVWYLELVVWPLE